MCDTEFGNINIPNTNYQNKDEIERNFPKIRNIIDSLVNNNSNLRTNYHEFQDRLSHNFFIPHAFKDKRYIQEFKPANKESLEKELNRIKNQNRDEVTNHDNKNYDSTNNKFNINNEDSFEILVKNNSGENLDTKNTKIFLGNKRKLNHENKKNEIPKIHEELINLYNSYSNDNKANEKSKNIIYNGSRGYFDRNETIIINNIPICVIYFDHKNITKIYVIKERKNYERESDIKSILKQLIKDLRDSNK